LIQRITIGRSKPFLTVDSKTAVVYDDERRLCPRVKARYPARFWGIDAEGRAVKEDVLLDNLGAGGLYAQLTRRLEKNTPVSVAVSLSTNVVAQLPSLRLGVRGIVARTEVLADGAFGVAVRFTKRRVL
jgi:hypothetical protein